MAINFPASPSVNDTYTVNSVVYTWDGTKWNASTGFVSYTYADKIQEGDSTAEVVDNGGDAYFAVTNNAVEKFRVNVDGQLSTPYAGNASSPALYVGGDINSGLYSPGADQLALATNGTERLLIDSTGRIGANVTMNATYGVFNLGGITGASGAEFHIGYGTNGDNYYTAGQSGIHVIRNNASEYLRINSNGQIGIGSSFTNADLVLAKSGAPVFRIGKTATRAVGDIGKISFAVDSALNESAAIDAINTGGSNAATAIGFRTWNGSSSGYRLYISSSGSIGVGTTSPDAPLNVVTTSGGSAVTVIGLENLGTTVGTGATLALRTYTGASGTRTASAIQSIGTDTSGGTALTFLTNGANERARIDSSGRLLVGTQSTTTEAEAVIACKRASVANAHTSSVANGGYIQLSPAGASTYTGFLAVSSAQVGGSLTRTQTTFCVFGRSGDSTSIQQIATDNGSIGPASFTVSIVSVNGLDYIRATNTSGFAVEMSMSWFGDYGR